MSFGRIWGVFLRYFYLFAKLDYVCDLFFWPVLDIFLWGMTSMWVQNQQGHVPGIALAILTGLIFWHVIWRSNYEISVNLLQEFWNRNMINLFSTPIRFSEWIIALMIAGVVKIIVGLMFGAFIVWLLYTLNVFTLGWIFLPYCVSLTLSGWVLGFASAGIIVYFGQRLQALAWMMAYLFAPFCAVYYPVDSLPVWGQWIAYSLPMTYIFEGMRAILFEHVFSWSHFLTSIVLNIVFLTGSIVFFKCMFEKSREKGLGRLE